MQANVESPFARALLAGALAGTTVDLSLYPIDTLKTRLQSQTGFYASGGFRGIFAGVGSALVGSAPGAALFFVSYEGIKSALKKAREGDDYGSGGRGRVWVKGEWSEPLEHMAAASAGEVAACAVRVPTEVIKQRTQALQQSSSISTLRRILSQRSTIGVLGVWREMYRGWSITIMREVPFTIIQFPFWEGLKEWRRRTSGQQGVSGGESAVFGSVSGAVAAGVTTPLDVLKTRMILARERVSVMGMLAKVLRESGPRAFFAGMGPRVLWISAGGAVFLGSYQWAWNMMAER